MFGSISVKQTKNNFANMFYQLPRFFPVSSSTHKNLVMLATLSIITLVALSTEYIYSYMLWNSKIICFSKIRKFNPHDD